MTAEQLILDLDWPAPDSADAVAEYAVGGCPVAS
jgi:hypothetical protein